MKIKTIQPLSRPEIDSRLGAAKPIMQFARAHEAVIRRLPPLALFEQIENQHATPASPPLDDQATMQVSMGAVR